MIFGGFIGNKVGTFTNNLWRYEPLKNQFNLVIEGGEEGFPEARIGHTTDVKGNFLYVFGGKSELGTLNDM